MKHIFSAGFLVIGMLAATGGLQAQRYYDRDDYGRQPMRVDLFDRVQGDLDRAARNAYRNHRIEHAFHELGEFRARFNSGRSAHHELDSAIGAIRDLANSDVLPPADRNILQNDVVAIRRFREDYRRRVY